MGEEDFEHDDEAWKQNTFGLQEEGGEEAEDGGDNYVDVQGDYSNEEEGEEGHDNGGSFDDLDDDEAPLKRRKTEDGSIRSVTGSLGREMGHSSEEADSILYEGKTWEVSTA